MAVVGLGQAQGAAVAVDDEASQTAVESYNPASNAWSTLPAMPTLRSALASTAGPARWGRAVLACTRWVAWPPGRSYNPASNVWTTLPAMPTPRLALGAATTTCPPGQTGTCVYAVGGLVSGGAPTGTMEALDPPPAKSND